MKKHLQKIRLLRILYRLAMTLCQPFKKQSLQPIQEIAIFELIAPDCEIVFDVGCREDIGYLNASVDPSMRFYLFEPNPIFVSRLNSKIDNATQNIIVSQLGFGREKGMVTYYPDSQSFVKRSIHFESKVSSIQFPIDTVTNFCSVNEIENIDFLKIDVEGMELDVLLGGKDIIQKTCKYVQFEFGSTMLDAKILPEDLYCFFSNDFNLYLLKVDPGHPLFNTYKNLLTPLTELLKVEIEDSIRGAFGCNLFAIRKNLHLRTEMLSEFQL